MSSFPDALLGRWSWSPRRCTVKPSQRQADGRTPLSGSRRKAAVVPRAFVTARFSQEPSSAVTPATCCSQTVCEQGEIFRSLEQEPISDSRNAQGRIEPAQIVHGPPGLLDAASKRVACRDDADRQQEAWRIPEGLLRP